MEALPTELRNQILSDCTLCSVRSLRRTWATLGFEYLLSSTFTTLPHRPDFERLLAVSKVPLFSQRLETLCINLGEINEYHARHNSYFVQYMRDPDDRLATSEQSWGAFAGFRKDKTKHMQSACLPGLLDPALKNLPELRKIEVSLATCPFPEGDEKTELLRQIWNIPSTRHLPRVSTTERFTALLNALAASPSTVTELSHDWLPFEFFQQRSKTMRLVSTLFTPLTSLSLTLDYSDMPNNLHASQTFQNLSLCLRSASGLQSLNLAFQGRRKTNISLLFISFSEHNHIFTNLQSLKLEGVACTENELVAFLAQHKASLKKIQLGGLGPKVPHQKANGGVHLSEGTWNGLFRRTLACLHLEGDCFLVQGDLVQSGRRVLVRDEPQAVESLGSLDAD